MKYVHHPDFTCLSQSIAFSRNQTQTERYEYPFVGPPEHMKANVRIAVYAALEAREKRGISAGRMHVEIDEDNPGGGRVVDNVQRLEESAELDSASVSAPTAKEDVGSANADVGSDVDLPAKSTDK